MTTLTAPDYEDGEESAAAQTPGYGHHISVWEAPLLIAGEDSPRVGGGIIKGNITIAGSSPESAYAALFVDQSPSWVQSTKIGPDGSYAFSRLAPGRYAIAIIDGNGEYRGKLVHTEVL